MDRLPYRSWVEVSRQQIGDNFAAVRSVVGEAVEVMPVVKADAYRHGAVEVSRVLQSRGATWLAVSNTDEGVTLRDAGIDARILVMADFLPFTREAMLAYDLTPVIHSLDDVAELNRLARARETSYKFHLKVDTGMGRLGVRPDAQAIVGALAAAPYVELEGLMTHFASSGNYQSKQTEEQIQTFTKLAAALGAGRHCSAISAFFEHDSDCVWTEAGLVGHGAARPRHLRICFAGARQCAAEVPRREAGADVAGHGSFSERSANGSADRLWRHVSSVSTHAHCDFGCWICRWHSSSLIKPRKSDRAWQIRTDAWRRFDGCDHD